MTMPAQKPGRSKQDYATPPALLEAVLDQFGIEAWAWDLAADTTNAVCLHYFSLLDDSLKQDWAAVLEGGWGWLNPPFAHIRPWVQKAHEEQQRGAHVAMLLPAGVGANWWRDWVHEKAAIYFLNGRLTFVGETTPYPKDCAIVVYGAGSPCYEVWNWRAAS